MNHAVVSSRFATEGEWSVRDALVDHAVGEHRLSGYSENEPFLSDGVRLGFQSASLKIFREEATEKGKGGGGIRPKVAVFPRFRAGPHSCIHLSIY